MSTSYSDRRRKLGKGKWSQFLSEQNARYHDDLCVSSKGSVIVHPLSQMLSLTYTKHYVKIWSEVRSTCPLSSREPRMTEFLLSPVPTIQGGTLTSIPPLGFLSVSSFHSSMRVALISEGLSAWELINVLIRF